MTGRTDNAAQDRKRVHLLVYTVTERCYYDPVELAEKFGITTADEVIEFFELHDGSPYGDLPVRREPTSRDRHRGAMGR